MKNILVMMGVSAFYWKMLRVIFITFVTTLVIIVTSNIGSSEPPADFPDPKSHPLPSALAAWEVKEEVGDYFSEIKESPLGYLVWSEFPITVFLDLSASKPREQEWVEAVETAIAEWNDYIPLKEVDDRATADIIIARSRPPVNIQRNPETGQREFGRARTARTRYEFDLEDSRLIHLMFIDITPNQPKQRTLATARHEIGHGLGIWGHSEDKNDALYYSHVRDSPKISPRDVNTLRKIYEQPTRLGWKIEQ